MKPFTGVVLAGGRSKRMGRDKSELVFNQQSLLQRATMLLSEAGAEDVLCCTNSESTGICDIYKDSGPLAGIHAAANHALHDLLIIPVDMPLLNYAALQNLLGHDADAVCYQAKPLPLFLRNTLSIRMRLDSILDDQHKSNSLHSFLDSIVTVTFDPPSDLAMLNVNTPTEFNYLIREFD